MYSIIDDVTKGGFKSENVEVFVNLPKNIPKSYLKFVHPVHDIDKTSIIPKSYLKFVHPVYDIDKTSILNFFDFTSLTYLQVVQKGFWDLNKKSYMFKAFYTYTNKQQ